MVTRGHAIPLVGQHIVVRTHDGTVHHGYLHSVTGDGIYLRPISGNTRLASTDIGDQPVLLDNASAGPQDVEQTWFPFLFFPFFALAWLGAWGLWW